MRDVILKLNDLFGAHNGAMLSEWFNHQSLRQGETDEQLVSLFDVEEKSIVKAIERLINCVPISATQLVEHVFLVPALNSGKLDIECVPRFRSTFFQYVLTASDDVIIDSAGIVKRGDIFERYGHDKHVIHKPIKNNEMSPPVLAYINGTVEKTNYTFSVVLNEQELEGIKTAHVETLYNGVNPYHKNELDDVFLAAAFERLLDEEAFAYLSGIIDDNAVNVLQAVKQFNAERYKKQKEDESKIYSSYGKLVAVKKHRFKALDRVHQKRQPPVELKLVASTGSKNGESTDNDSISSEYDDIAQDFGGF